MNTRKLLAKLGPKTPKLVRGMHCLTHDNLTPQDIAGALGFIKVRPGRELYEYLWVPNACNDPAKRNSLAVAFGGALRDEQERRMRSGRNAFPNPPATLCVTPFGGNSTTRFCIRVAHSCLTELVKRNDCASCKGYGQKVVQDKLGVRFETCTGCIGSGTVPMGKEARAKLIGVRVDAYRKNVDDAYKWLLGYMREQESLAAEEHWRALNE